MATVEDCIHDYKQMVSHGERHWLKCTKCYEVAESEFMIEGVAGNPATLRITGFLNPSGHVVIPEVIHGRTVTQISPDAFAGQTAITNISIPDSVRYIPNTIATNFNVTTRSHVLLYSNIGTNQIVINGIRTGFAFSGAVNIPSHINNRPVTQISQNAFLDQTNLTNITLPHTLTHIGDWAFARTGLTDIVIPASVTHIGSSSFINTQLTNISFRENLLSISNHTASYQADTAFGDALFTNIAIATVTTLKINFE